MTEKPISSITPSMNRDGSRHWIRPKLSQGSLYYKRLIVGWLLIVVFVALPHLRIASEPVILLDVVHRKFVFFGKTFLATDAILLLLVLLSIFLGIFWFTALFGRVWCGWGCPQTVYMELLFRPLERLIEGPPKQQRANDAADGIPARRVLKNIVFFLIAILLGNTFLAYFVGTDQLFTWMKGSPMVHPTAFGVMFVVSVAVWFDFGWFREQTCLVACPYGRFQSVLLDRDSLIVAYDHNRGENRGTMRDRRGKKKPDTDEAADAEEAAAEGAEAQEAWGDCIDCKACVVTCPTGIDIRDGLQMECINCTQCIDACDAIMEKINKPTGLIRYSSQAELASEKRHLLRARTILYPAAIAILLTVFGILIGMRGDAYITVLRDGSKPYQTLQTNQISNTVIIKIANHSRATKRYRIKLNGPKGLKLIAPTNPLPVDPSKVKTTRVVVLSPPDIFNKEGIREVTFAFYVGKKKIGSQKHELLGPENTSSK